MSARGTRLLEAAEEQINDLIGLMSAGSDAVLSLPCPGREKLGDGTVGACAVHTADRYQLIAGFLRTASEMPGAPTGHQESGHDEAMHHDGHLVEHVDLHGLLDRLSAGSDALGLLADLTDEQLDAVPPSGSFRFCDGQRTLEQVVGSLLKHQAHQVEAVRAAVARGADDLT